MRALITGASHGLGLALTEELLDRGHEVLAVDIDTNPLDELAVKSRGACMVRLADLSNPGSVERFMLGLGDMKFDLVVLNAGISATGKFEEIPSAAYAKLLTVNLQTPLVMASTLVRQNNMAARGKIVFISSLSHVTGYPGASVYAASKDAIAAYANSVRKPFRKKGVGVLTVFPGPIRTEHAKRHAPKGAKAANRMLPEKLAVLILKAAAGKTRELYPGNTAALAKLLGRFAPVATTRMMRKKIFEKLEGPVY